MYSASFRAKVALAANRGKNRVNMTVRLSANNIERFAGWNQLFAFENLSNPCDFLSSKRSDIPERAVVTVYFNFSSLRAKTQRKFVM
jgi:hypothetical protein